MGKDYLLEAGQYNYRGENNLSYDTYSIKGALIDSVSHGKTWNSTGIPVVGTDGVVQTSSNLTFDGTTLSTNDNPIDSPTGRGPTLKVAASNASDIEKYQADYVASSVTDDKITTAITALPSTGGSISLSSGTFAPYVVAKSNVTVMGQGYNTIIKVPNGSNLTAITLGNSTDAFLGINIGYMYIDGNKNNQTTNCYGILFTKYVTLTHVHDFKIINAKKHGIATLATTTGEANNNNAITNFEIEGSTDNGINWQYGQHLIIQNTMTYIRDSGSYGIYMGIYTTDSRLNNLIVYGSGIYNISISDKIYMTNCNLSGGGGSLYLSATANGSEFMGGQIKNATNIGVYMLASECTFNSTTLINAGTQLLNIEGSHNVFTGCYFGCGSKTTNNASANIYVKAGAVNNNIIGNTFVLEATYATGNKPSYAIQNAGTGTLITANDLYSNPLYLWQTGILLDTGIGTICNNNVNYISRGELRTISIPITKTGSTLTTVSGTFTESPAILKPGINTLHCTVNGTANIVLPAGCTGVAASVGGGATVSTSPVALAAGTTLITVTAGGTNEFTVTVNAFAFALACPELQNCLIVKVEADITTTGGTATSTLKIGLGDTATDTSLGAEFFTAIDANAIAIRDSYLAGDSGAQTKYIPWNYTGTDDYLLGLFETEIANNIVGNILITYMGR
jgi:hypothetical protein